MSDDPQFKEYPTDIEVQTELGPIWLTAPTGDYIIADANHHSAMRRFGENDVPDASCHFMRVQHRGTTYDVVFDMRFNLVDGYFVPNDSTSFRRRHFDEKPVPPTLIERIRQAVTKTVNEWAQANPDLMAQAQDAGVNNSAYRQTDQVERAESALLFEYQKFISLAPDGYPGLERARQVAAILEAAGTEPKQAD